MDAARIAAALGDGELSALLLFQAEPLRTHPDQGAWQRALSGAGFVVAFADFVDDALTRDADVIFPAEAYAEKEGTITHPDGRLQRVRQAIGRPGAVRSQTSVLIELLGELMDDPGQVATPGAVTELVGEAVPFYGGITLDEIGGRGVRWQEREAASALPTAEPPSGSPETPPPPPEGLRLGTGRSLWTGREVRHAPVLRFLAQRQRAELSADDARRLGVATGDEVEVSCDGVRVRATVALRDGAVPGSVILLEGTDEDNATALTNGAARTVEVTKA
jgi:NADH-quinone oxidoreductase subunit G